VAAPKTAARAGIARSGDARSGYPIPVGARALLYALSNVARSGATRSNYTDGRVYISIGGIQVGTGRPDPDARVLVATASLRDELHEAPTTATLTAVGFVPEIGDPVTITIGSRNNGNAEFTGTVLRTTHGAITSDASVDQVQLACIDPTWGLDTRLVSAYFTGSASTIAAALVAGWAPGYTTQIQPGLATLSGGVTFTNQELSDCLTHLCKRIGTTWRCDYAKVVHIPADYPEETAPSELNAVHPSLANFWHDVDLSQQVTRVHVEGGGVTAAATLPPGEPMIPLIGDPSWYDPAGGVVVSGPQRIRYTGVSQGGGGGLVGTGAGPTGAVGLTQAAGTGVPPGAHGYAITFQTGTGESLAGPVSTIVSGAIAPPTVAPVAGAPTAGLGPDPGYHEYAITFVTATGETAAGPRVGQITAATPAPGSAPTVGAAQPGAGLEQGTHDYQVTFTTATGETTPGPVSGAVLIAPITTPAHPPTLEASANGLAAFWEPGDSLIYAYTWMTPAGGETLVGPYASIVAKSGGTLVKFWEDAIVPLGVSSLRLYRYVTGSRTELRIAATIPATTQAFWDYGTTQEHPNPITPGPPSTSTAASSGIVPLSAIPLGPAGTGITGRKLYRRSQGAGFRLLAALANNTATTYTDATPSASLGAAPPASSTAGSHRIPLSGLQVPDNPLVTTRKLYGTAAGGAGAEALRFVADIGRTATTYTVATQDSALGAAPPASSTAFAQQVQVSGIPLGSSAVTARKLYRTAANAAGLQFLVTIANNTTTTFLDAIGDAALGAAPPTVDTSALQQPQGQVLAGSTVLPVASLAAFPPGGGWAVIGNGTQVIKYGALTAGALTGIPAAGTGAITASIAYNSTVTAAPMLTGIPTSLARRVRDAREALDDARDDLRDALDEALEDRDPGGVVNPQAEVDPFATEPGPIRYPILRGSDVNLWITETDAAAVASRAALLGTDGIQEDYHQDRRLGRGEARARALAILQLKKDPLVTVRYTCRDSNTRAGRTVVVNLGDPYNLYKVPLVIQSVTTTFIATRSGALATHTVEASSARLTFEQLVAMIR